MNLNLEHGASTLTGIPFDPEVVKRVLATNYPDHVADKKFEIAYVGREVFEDGYVSSNICYRIGVPGWTPRTQQQTGKPETETLLVKFGEFDATTAS